MHGDLKRCRNRGAGRNTLRNALECRGFPHRIDGGSAIDGQHFADFARHPALQLSQLASSLRLGLLGAGLREALGRMAGVTGLEPATSGVTGLDSNRLSYTPAVG